MHTGSSNSRWKRTNSMQSNRVTAVPAWGKLYLCLLRMISMRCCPACSSKRLRTRMCRPSFLSSAGRLDHRNSLLLEDLQAALAALQTGNQNHPSQAEEREQQYQSIFETASDGLIINDLETGLVVEANPAACTMYGYARDEFIGLHPTSFIHPDSSHQFTKYVQAVQSQGVYVALQVHMRRDGSQFYVELSGTVFTDQGRLVSPECRS